MATTSKEVKEALYEAVDELVTSSDEEDIVVLASSVLELRNEVKILRSHLSCAIQVLVAIVEKRAIRPATLKRFANVMAAAEEEVACGRTQR